MTEPDDKRMVLVPEDEPTPEMIEAALATVPWPPERSPIEERRRVIEAYVAMVQARPRRRPALTRRQREVLEFVGRHIERNGESPSYSEIIAGTGLASKSRVHYILWALNRKGYVALSPSEARSVLPVEEDDAPGP